MLWITLEVSSVEPRYENLWCVISSWICRVHDYGLAHLPFLIEYKERLFEWLVYVYVQQYGYIPRS